LTSIETRATMPVIRTRVLRSKRMARSIRRGVGMKGTGRMRVRSVVDMEKAMTRVVWPCRVVHCTVIS
jgi:hypothetical protein